MFLYSLKLKRHVPLNISIMLNENLKAIRKAKGLSQQELAVKLNVVRQTISKWKDYQFPILIC